MRDMLKYLILTIVTIVFIVYLKINIDNTIQNVKKDFDKTEIYNLESLSSNISNVILNEVKDATIFETLKKNKNLQKELQKNLEIIIGKKYKYAYLLHQDDTGHFRILLDGSKDDKYFFNEPFNVISSKWRDIYSSGELGFFRDEGIESIWMTYVYPIVVDGKVQALLAIDFSTEEIEKTLNYFTPLQNILNYTLFTIVFASIGIFILFYLWFMKRKEVTKNKELLEENQHFFSEIINAQSSIIVTHKKGKLSTVNSAFYTFFEIETLEEFYMKHECFVSEMNIVNDDNSEEHTVESLLKEFEDNIFLKVELQDNIFTLFSKNLIFDGEKVSVITLTNITELEAATNKAKESSKAKSNFLASMSHEIRTPMNAIVGLTDLTLDTTLTTRQRDFLSKIKLSTSSLLSIINDILDFSKIEAGKMELEYKSFKLFDLVQKVRNIFETQSRYDHINFNIFLDPKLPECVITDIIRLEQVIINLLGNAFKFTHKGSISLEILSSINDNYNIIVKVKDTGIGIPPSKISTLFDSFTQVDTSTTRKYGGTGLGLSITKKIIDLMNGIIKVHSTENVGTEFEVFLKLDIDENCKSLTQIYSNDNEIVEIQKYKNIKILIAEDNFINQDVIRGYLEKFDFNLTIVNDGVEALEKFSLNKFDLIFMDINMPNMGGYEATHEIRKIDKTIPIIALSANARQDDFQHSVDAGMNKHVSKPINPILLYQVLLQYLPISKYQNRQLFNSSKSQIFELTNKDDYYFKCIDSSKMLEYLSQNKILFDKILEQFFQDYKDYDEIKEDLFFNLEKSKDYFHTLKSVSGIIHAKDLFTLVTQHYQNINNNALDKKIYDELFIALEKTINEIKEYIVQKNSPIFSINEEQKIIDENTRNKLFDSITTSLKSKKSKQIKVAIENIEGKNFNLEDLEKLEKAKNFIAKYDFESALKIMES